MEEITLYLVCAWDNYYPESADKNVKAIFLNQDDAEAYYKQLVNNQDRKYDWYEIVRRTTVSLDK